MIGNELLEPEDVVLELERHLNKADTVSVVGVNVVPSGKAPVIIVHGMFCGEVDLLLTPSYALFKHLVLRLLGDLRRESGLTGPHDALAPGVGLGDRQIGVSVAE